MINLTKERKVELLKAFNSQPELFQAVREELLACIYKDGVVKDGEDVDATHNWALSLAWGETPLSNEQLGEKIAAIAEGIRFIEVGFDTIAKKYVNPTISPIQPNKAR